MKVKTWESEWKDFKKSNFWGRRLHKEQKRTIKQILSNIKLTKNAKILDMGCGGGRTLSWFREFGYKNSIGIDNSKNSIKLCQQRGFRIKKDIFLMNASRTKFKKNRFDLVFADGVLEHYKDFSPLVKEITRISKRYVLITQPNHFSFFGRVLKFFGRHTVFEYSYKIEDFKKAFKTQNFMLKIKRNYNLNEQFALLFER